ncbi:MAG: SDR family NAD(P)-dependent oxidoreductase, partial [Desulfobacteraceae bacterium]
HLILEEAFPQPEGEWGRDHQASFIISLSTKTKSALQDKIRDLKYWLASEKNGASIEDIAYTLATRRNHFSHRACWIVKNIDELVGKLGQGLQRSSVGLPVEFDSSRNQAILQDDHLVELCQSYLKGKEVDFKKLFRDKKYNHLSLPAYPFARERYWISGAAAEPDEDFQPSPPLIDAVKSANKKVNDLMYQKRITLDLSMVKNHRINGQAIFPGVAYLEMAYVAGYTKNRRLDLVDVLWINPIIVGQEGTLVKLKLSGPESARQFEITNSDDSQTVLYAKGRIEMQAKADQSYPERLAIAEIKAGCHMIQNDMNAFYSRLRSSGIYHGRYFQALRKIHSNEKEALGRIRLAEEYKEELTDYFMHPVLMDCALQTITHLVWSRNRTENKTMMPFSLERVSVFSALPSEIYAYARKIKRNHFDITITDLSGQVLVKLADLHIREAKEKTDRFYYVPIWKQVIVHSQYDRKSGSCLIVNSNESAQLAVALEKAHNNAQTTTLSNLDELNSCLERLRSLDTVYFLGGFRNRSLDLTDLKVFEECRTQGIYALFKLIKALSRFGFTESLQHLKIIVNDVSKISDEAIANPFAGSLLGLATTIAKEYPQIKVSCIDIEGEPFKFSHSNESLPLVTRQIIMETSNGGGEIVAWRKGKRYLRKLKPITIPSTDPVSFRQGGVYLVLGGAGGIGLALTEHLAETYRAKLVLIGRSKLKEKQKQTIKRIENSGAEILYLQADATNLESMERAVRQSKSRFGTIHGVFHSAIVLADRTLERMTDNEFAAAFDPKAIGSVILHQVLINEPLDFLVFFSAAQSFSANAGQGNYAAGCTFKDSFACYLAEVKPYPVKVVNWGYWGEVGIVASDEYKKRLELQGVHSISTKEGIQAITRILGSSFTQTVAIKAENRALVKMGIENAGEQKPDRTIDLESFVEETISNILCESLELQKNQLNREKDFSEYGIDSISGVALINRINNSLEILLRTTVIFDYSTIKDLTHHVCKKFGPQIAARLKKQQDSLEIPLKEDMVVIPKSYDEKPDCSKFQAVLIEGPGDLKNLAVQRIEPGKPEEDEIQIRVRAFSLNFSDLLCISGLYPNMPEYPFIPGTEVAGVVLETGSRVGSFTRGDEVIALMGPEMGGQSQVVTVKEHQLVLKPSDLSFEEACAFPVVFSTMDYVFNKAALKPGEKILIQTAAGGIGLVAVQMAQLAQAEIFATAGSQEKLNYLRQMGVKLLINYQEEDFSSFILKETDNYGVDVVINTLSGDAIQKGINILAPNGRYFEIAMAGLKATKNLDLSGLVDNQTFYSVNLGRQGLITPQEQKDRLNRMVKALDKKELRPIVSKVFPFSQVKEAYQFLQDRGNIGKVVVRMPGPKILPLEKITKYTDIAVIGMSGRFPQADTLEEFWNNLAQGKSAITEVPKERWDIDAHYNPDPGDLYKTYCRHGGFLSDIDKFDPAVFNMSGKEADLSDPQQRLFLEESWKALEDAGYSRKSISNTKCGVFVGVGQGDYLNNMKAVGPVGEPHSFWGNATCILPARVSYFFDLKGPALAVDTACSSSLAAIHLALQSIFSGESDMALAGGVFVHTTPEFFILCSNAEMLSFEGKCKTFDDRADGFVPGEGVGVVVLKALDKALKDGDHIYGLIKGSSINHDGKTSGITAPSTLSQTAVESAVYQQNDIDTKTISYIEAHGTGTKLGDPVEIDALHNIFKKAQGKPAYCALGSVKTNIGHTAAAAGVASLIKVLLSLQHKKIPPSLNFEKPNRHINFADSPFYVNTALKEWNEIRKVPRRAAISSFGLSGTNVHMVVEEFTESVDPSIPLDLQKTHIVPLSAANEERLYASADLLKAFLERQDERTSLQAIAYTLQTGREEMVERLAIVASSFHELKERLSAFCSKKNGIPGIYRENVRNIKRSSASSTEKNSHELSRFWTSGGKVDWRALYSGKLPLRMSLPTYSFARERHWFKQETKITDRGISPATNRVQIDKCSQTLCYRKIWKEKELKKTEQSDKLFDAVVVFDMVRGQFKIAGENVITVIPGNTYHHIDSNTYEINPDQEADYTSLVGSLAEKKLSSLAICHFWSIYTDKTNVINNHTTDYLSIGTYSIFFLLKSFFRSSKRLLKRFLFFYNIPSPTLTAVSGFCRSLGTIDEDLFFSTFRLEKSQTGAQIPELINRELYAPYQDVDHEVMYRNRRRYVSGYQRISGTSTHKNRLKSGGTYLITGGCGGLGMILAKHLARTYQANLILVGRSPIDDQKEAFLTDLRQFGSQAVYLVTDISKEKGVEYILQEIKKQFGGLQGIIHAAGSANMLEITAKNKAEFSAVLDPKIQGTLILDRVTRMENLDFFLMFSSLSSILGDFGQGDYAVANRFMDEFAVLRQSQVKEGKRNGDTFSINWPLWRDGGIHQSREGEALYLKSSGMDYLETKKGLEIFEAIVSGEYNRVVVITGDPSRIDEMVGVKTSTTHHLESVTSGLKKLIESDLQKIAAELLRLNRDQLYPEENLGNFGFDSITLKSYARQLSETFKLEISPSLFFERSTIEGLVGYLLEHFEDKLKMHYQGILVAQTSKGSRKGSSHKRFTGYNQCINGEQTSEIAIIGLQGIFPGSRNLEDFWQKLLAEKCLISEVPSERWNWRDYRRRAENGETRGIPKWGGFITDIDKFDADFFDITPREARMIDPQHRLALQTVWKTIEDAGYRVSDFSGRSVGVFMGVESSDYRQLLEAKGIQNVQMPTGNHHAMLPNRISFLLNLQGPSESINTACSSSSVAVHRAIGAIRNKECELAIAGGVSLILSPYSVETANQLGILSQDGRCKTFDKDADGYVKGEGVAAILLKPLQKAVEDGDSIRAIIKHSGINHGGRAHSLMAPNSEAHARLLAKIYSEANIDPTSISYIEAHGTGTELGDPVEIEGLKKAFENNTKSTDLIDLPSNYCGVGTVKTNIGHLEPASGIAGIIKVVLAMERGKLPGNPCFKQLNPY